MTGFWTDFTSSVWNFCGWVVDVPPRETSTSGEEWGETAVFAGLAVWRDFKTPLPSTMTDGRLISLVILHKHKQVDIDGIITEFPRLKGRRLFRPLLVAPLMTSLFYSFFFFVNNVRVKSTTNSFIYLVTENVLHDTQEVAFLRP